MILEFKREVLAQLTSLYAERFRLNKMNTRFGVANINETDLERIIEDEGNESLIDHHSVYLTRVFPDSSISLRRQQTR